MGFGNLVFTLWGRGEALWTSTRDTLTIFSIIDVFRFYRFIGAFFRGDFRVTDFVGFPTGLD